MSGPLFLLGLTIADAIIVSKAQCEGCLQALEGYADSPTTVLQLLDVQLWVHGVKVAEIMMMEVVVEVEGG